MDKYRRLAVELITAYGGDGQKQACENYRNLLKTIGIAEQAAIMTDADLVQSAKFFLKNLPSHLRD